MLFNADTEKLDAATPSADRNATRSYAFDGNTSAVITVSPSSANTSKDDASIYMVNPIVGSRETRGAQ